MQARYCWSLSLMLMLACSSERRSVSAPPLERANTPEPSSGQNPVATGLDAAVAGELRDDRVAGKEPGTPDTTKVVEYVTFRPTRDEPGCGDCVVLSASQIAAVNASSSLRPENRYGPGKLVDDSMQTAWCEGGSGDGAGEWVVLELARPLPVDSIVLHPGYLKSDATLFDNGRPTILRVDIDDGASYRVKLPEYPADYASSSSYIYPTIELDGSSIQRIRITVEAVLPGKAANDTCISGVRIEVLEP